MQNTNPRFTILIPVIKTLYFNEALESALAQSFDNFEILVLDNKADADLSWVTEKKNTRLLKNETQLAPAPNWNKGIENSRGEYIVLLCDDDLLVPETLTEINNFLKKHNDDLDIVRFLRKEFSGTWTGSFSAPGKEIETAEEYLYFQLKYFRGQALSDFVFSRKTALEIGGFPEMPGCLASDKSFVATLATKKNKIGNINLPLLNYRWHSANYTTKPRPNLYLDSLDSDFYYRNLVIKILDESKSPYAGIAKWQNFLHWKARQNSHFDDALRVFGWRGLFQIYKHAPITPASKKKSFFLAIANKLRRIVTGKKH